MADLFGVFPPLRTRLEPADDPSWRFYNRYVGEHPAADPWLFDTRREANEARDFNLELGVRRIGLVIVKRCAPGGGPRA